MSARNYTALGKLARKPVFIAFSSKTMARWMKALNGVFNCTGIDEILARPRKHLQGYQPGEGTKLPKTMLTALG